MNNTSIWDYEIPAKHNVKSTGLMEEEAARIFSGLTVEQYESLAGTQYWATEETAIGIYECKSDVLVYYRSQKLIEAIINFLDYGNIK